MTPPNADLDRLRDALRVARLHLYRQRFAQSLYIGIGFALRMLVGISVIVLLYVVVQQLINRQHAEISRGVFYLVLAIAAGCGLVKFAALATWRPHDIAAAERLDLRHNQHNQIATALDLLTHGDKSAFAQEAIAAGLASADALKRRTPFLESASLPWKPVLGWSALAALIWLGVIGMPALKGAKESLKLAQDESQNPAIQQSDHSPPPTTQENKERQDNRIAPDTARNPTTNPVQTKFENADLSGKSTSSVGASGAASSGKNSGGDKASEERPLPQTNAPQPPTAQAPSKPSSGSGVGAAATGSSTGGIGSAGKGGGGKSLAVENESRKQDAAGIDVGNDAGGDNVEADEKNENRHRGGAQPLMQDRRQAPTRELGMSGAKGSPGNGRGGPTPAKKARGAGALLLGVPMPDFVPGRLLAGTSKISRENTRPEESHLPLPPPANLAARNSDESIIRRFDVPLEDAELFRRYCDELYKESPAPTTQGVP